MCMKVRIPLIEVIFSCLIYLSCSQMVPFAPLLIESGGSRDIKEQRGKKGRNMDRKEGGGGVFGHFIFSFSTKVMALFDSAISLCSRLLGLEKSSRWAKWWSLIQISLPATSSFPLILFRWARVLILRAPRARPPSDFADCKWDSEGPSSSHNAECDLCFDCERPLWNIPHCVHTQVLEQTHTHTDLKQTQFIKSGNREDQEKQRWQTGWNSQLSVTVGFLDVCWRFYWRRAKSSDSIRD